MKLSYTSSNPHGSRRCLVLFAMLFACCCLALPTAAQQSGTVTGTVSDETGAPLPGVAITVSGTSRGTTTDNDGRYSIRADRADKLNFNFLGYKPYTMTVGTQTQIDVQLTVDNTNLD